MRIPLITKLLALNVALLAIAIVSIWLAIDNEAASYFMSLMKKYEIDSSDVNEMFLAATHRTLIWTSGATLLLAVILAFFFTRRLLQPLSRMAAVSARLGAGDYSARVAETRRDEIGALARDFDRMAEALERHERLRRTMVIDVAHELRTPVTNLRGYLEALADGVVAPSQEVFGSLHEESLRLAALVEDLVESTRRASDQALLHKTHLDLEVAVRQAAREERQELLRRGIRVRLAIPQSCRRISADPDKLQRIFSNLIRNACRYAAGGSRLSVSAKRREGRVHIEFSNRGGDLDPEDLPMIFEMFYRGEKSRSRQHGGAGLGLAIVKQLVEAHGGEVGAHSRNGDTAIWLTLPA